MVRNPIRFLEALPLLRECPKINIPTLWRQKRAYQFKCKKNMFKNVRIVYMWKKKCIKRVTYLSYFFLCVLKHFVRLTLEEKKKMTMILYCHTQPYTLYSVVESVAFHPFLRSCGKPPCAAPEDQLLRSRAQQENEPGHHVSLFIFIWSGEVRSYH